MSVFDSWPRTRLTLIQRVRNRADQASWLEFDGIYRPFLHHVARRFGLSAADAEDLVQEIFAKVVGAIAEFELDKQRGRFRGWLKTIAIHALSDRRRRRHLSPLRADQELAIEDPLEKLWDEEYRQHVLSFALGQVRKDSKSTTWACFAECKLNGRPAAEVAASLGMKVDAVHQNVGRTMERLRKQCEEYEEEPGIPDVPRDGL
jgi:RNA polymerase sigma-70 factor (ECF subfamily)